MAPKPVEVLIRAKNAVGQGVGAAKRDLGAFVGSVKNLLGGIPALLGGISLGAIFAKSMQEARDAEAELGRLRGAVENLGLSFDDARPQIDETLTRLTRLTGRDGGEVSDALADLTTKTQDLQAAMKLLPLVLDIAAKEQIDLAAATDIVAKTHAGNLRGLKQLNIETKDASQAMEILRGRYAGFAEREGQTWSGTMGRMGEAANTLAEKMGTAVTQNSAFRGIIEQVIGALQRGAEWFEENQFAVAKWIAIVIYRGQAMVTYLVNIAKIARNAVGMVSTGFALSVMGWFRLISSFVGWVLNEVAREVNEIIVKLNQLPGVDIKVRLPEGLLDDVNARLDKGIADAKSLMVEAGREIVQFGGEIKDAWTGIEERANRAAAASGRAAGSVARGLKTAAGALDDAPAERAQRGAVRKAIEQREKQEGADRAPAEAFMVQGVMQAAGRAMQGAPIPSSADIAASGRASLEGMELPGAMTVGGEWSDIFLDAADKLAPLEERTRAFGESLNEVTSGAIEGFADASAGAFEAWITGSGEAGKAFKAAIGDAVKSAALAEGKLYAGKALAALGEGFFTGKPNAFLAAAKYGAASAALFALAGAGGALGGGGGGGGGGSGAGSGGSGLGPEHDTAREQLGRPTNVIFKGSKYILDANNPDDLDAFKGVLGSLLDTREINLVVEPA